MTDQATDMAATESNKAETPALTLEDVKKQYIAPAMGVIALMDSYGVVMKLSGVTMKGIKAETGEPKSIEMPAIDTGEDGFDLEAAFDAAIEELVKNSDKEPEEALQELLAIGKKNTPAKLPKSKEEVGMALLGEVPKMKKIELAFTIGHFSVGSYGKDGYQSAFGFNDLELDLNGLIAIGMKALPMILAMD